MSLRTREVHVCHIIVDGRVDAPDTLGKMLGSEVFEKMRAKLGDGILKPGALAETFFHVAAQHRSAWTFELDLRPFSDEPWWNT